MNTKNKIIAILMASIVAMAVGVPMAIGSVTTSASVGDVGPTYTCSATVSTAPGPNSDGQVDFELVVTDLNGAGDISDTGWTAAWNSRTTTLAKTGETTTTKTFTGNDAIPYCTAPATYTVTFTGGCTDTFVVGSYKGLSLNFNKVTFSGNADSTDNPGTAYMGAVEVTTPEVTSEGNVETDVGVIASDLTKTPDTITGDNMDANIKALGWQPANPKHVFTEANLACDGTASAAFQLDIPAGTPSGSYVGSLTISAE